MSTINRHFESLSPLHAEAHCLSEKVNVTSNDSDRVPSQAEFEARRTSECGDIVSVAPMMEWTDRHYRFLVRLLSKRTRLYSEMIVANTLLYSPIGAGFLRFHPIEHPIACQIGGSDPDALAAAAVLVEEAGYDEVNLNCGCPSPRVAGKGCFGAAMMFQPELVRECVAAMAGAVRIPVTVKCRLGVDALDSYEAFSNFLRVVSEGGCTHFLVHARKAFLKGLDPKANRTVPPLRYSWAQRAALEFPQLRISVNGGIVNLDQTEQLLSLNRRGPALTFELDSAVSTANLSRRSRNAKAAGTGSGATAEEMEDDAESGITSAVREVCGGPSFSRAAAVDCKEESDELEVEAWRKEKESKDEAKERLYIQWKSHKEKAAAHDAMVCRLPPAQFHEGVRQGLKRGGEYGGRGAVLDSVMIGRAAYGDSWILSDVDRRLFGVPNPGLSRREVLARYVDYTESVTASLPPKEAAMHLYKPFELAKPLFGLFAGEYGCAKFRLAFVKAMQEEKMSLRDALALAVLHIPAEALDERAPGCG